MFSNMSNILPSISLSLEHCSEQITSIFFHFPVPFTFSLMFNLLLVMSFVLIIWGQSFHIEYFKFLWSLNLSDLGRRGFATDNWYSNGDTNGTKLCQLIHVQFQAKLIAKLLPKNYIFTFGMVLCYWRNFRQIDQ